MLEVLDVAFHPEAPMAGVELKPVVLVETNGQPYLVDLKNQSVDGRIIRYRWYRVQDDPKVAVCSIHPTKKASWQCIACVKGKLPKAWSYFCSPKCYLQFWHHHHTLHEWASNAVDNNGTEGLTVCSDEPLHEVGCSRSYTPSAVDIGYQLKIECVAVDVESDTPQGSICSAFTLPVAIAPSCPRRMIRVDGVGLANLECHGTFKVLSYNILPDYQATGASYVHCPSWVLSWSYRRHKLLLEIICYRADILCLQRVQHDHFEDFFAPELHKHGYEALYMARSFEVYSEGYKHRAIDGCATFYRRDRLSLVRKYEVEFNKAALNLTGSIPASHMEFVMKRLTKGDVALVAVFEAKIIDASLSPQRKRQFLCVANAYTREVLRDVNLWQVHSLLKGLQNIGCGAKMPLLLCGGFNCTPGSASYSLLTKGNVDPSHADLVGDLFRVLQHLLILNHELQLASAYSCTLDLEQRKRMDPITNEPLFTQVTKDFIDTVDYIFYTADSLMVESLLELLDKESIHKDRLPSPRWPSDHVSLVAEFKFLAGAMP